MKYIKKFDTLNAFNNFALDYTNTPNTSLIEELTGSNRIIFTPFIPIPVIHDYSQDYFTFVALESGTFTFNPNYDPESHDFGVSYSLDNGNTWTTEAATFTTPTIQAGNKVLFKSSTLKTSGYYDSSGLYIDSFISTCKFNVEGNIQSLMEGDNFVNTTNNNIYYFFFSNNTNIVNAEHLILPSNANPHMYEGMFYGCTSLVTAPELPATTLSESCYSMMFYNCSLLNSIKMLATSGLSGYNEWENPFNDWLTDTAASGTIIKDANTELPSGVVPSGWTVQNA